MMNASHRCTVSSLPSISGYRVGHSSNTRDTTISRKPEEINIHEALNLVRLNRLMAIAAAATCKKSETYSKTIDTISACY